ncbi:MAG TPA: hypothetical protein VIL12_04335 [Acidimicrobiia bacterium]
MREPDRGTILIDVSEDGEADFDAEFLKRLGHPVIVCHGPPHANLCPILTGTGCPQAEGAHGIVFRFDLDRAQHRAILAKYQQVVSEDVPIRVVVTPEHAVRYAHLLKNVEVWTHEPTAGDLDAFAAEVEAGERSG